MNDNSYPIKGFIETSFLDWPGQISSVLFLPGCNFRCPFCHNYGLVLTPEGFPDLEWPDLRDRLAKFRGWIDGVVLTGGEPTLTPNLADLIDDLRALSFKIKLDTNGARPEVLKQLIETGRLDAVAMDIKAPLNDFSYARATGRPGFHDRVKQSLDILASTGLPYTLRTTVVPGLHSEQDLLIMAEELKHAPEWILQNFKPDNALDPEYRNIKPWTDEEFEEMKKKVMGVWEGMAYVAGN